MSDSPAEENVLFCSGRDVRPIPEADRELLPYDLWASEVHGLMLYRTGILTKSEVRRLFKGFDRIWELVADKSFEFDPAKEDVHTHIESFLSEACGPEIGGKIHTGRSRNDQAACAMRLYLRANLLTFYRELLGLLSVLLRLAREHTMTVMPGLTHRQYGTVSSYGYLFTAYSQALVRDLERLASTYDRINESPLGAAAGYGTSWPIDRNLTAELLAFDGIQRNALDAVGTRWEAEADLVADLCFFMNHAAQIAADLIYWSSSAVKMLDLPDAFVTGSSIMPQKKNPDFAEVILAKSALVQGYLTSLLSLSRAVQSGYNREYQWTKYLVMDAVRETREVPAILGKVLQKASPNKEKMAAACREGFLNAIELADFLARKIKISFRDSHRLVASAVRECDQEGRFVLETVNGLIRNAGFEGQIGPKEFEELCDPLKSLLRRESLGSPQPRETLATVNRLSLRIRRGGNWLKAKGKVIHAARGRLNRAKKRLGT